MSDLICMFLAPNLHVEPNLTPTEEGLSYQNWAAGQIFVDLLVAQK